ncbi:putative regulatory protein, FmdB family [Natronobacterium gregoryi]|uniref:Regulatory protein, FmdB family n=3 Tax=Natronobacterium gregoryi TaxID=44930 RepID=L0AH41_NATGS|nr:putative regulatory protein, FmdB family [Natronobacterium gregoryi SP2]SFJ69228.1 putative regulatory protein, FmdB family [Natronobacterium gregoryi]
MATLALSTRVADVDGGRNTMPTHEFVCPDCGRTIPVTDAMREATEHHGCPLCGATVSQTQFA